VIGLSLSYCVRDIINGEVKLEDVEKIIAGTYIDSPDALEEVLEKYSQTYWKADPLKGRAISLQLFKSGKVEQPRLERKPGFDISEGHWKQ